MNDAFREHLQSTLSSIEADGLFKSERVIASPQGTRVTLEDGREVLNLCANNYLGLGNHPELVAAGHAALDRWGYGAASVRFICGTQGVHRELEQTLTQFLRMEDTILFPSCFDANGGVFETLLGPEDAVISDALNHASIIDGVRLCKAQRYRYANRDMAALEQQLKNADEAGARFKLIVTDAVFSMDGFIAPLAAICDLADKYDALVMVDDCHGVGFLGPNGRGTPELLGVDAPALTSSPTPSPPPSPPFRWRPWNCSLAQPNYATDWKPTPSTIATDSKPPDSSYSPASIPSFQ